MTPAELTDVTADWLVAQQDAEPHKGGWLVGDCWMDRHSVRDHAATCASCRAEAFAATQWRAKPGTQYTHTEVSGETFVDAQEFQLLPPEEIAGEVASRWAFVNYDYETLRVDDEVIEEDHPMHDTYWAAIRAAREVSRG